MRETRFQFIFLTALLLAAMIAQPVLAQRPPDGYARPPIHVRPFATSSPTGLSPAQTRTAYGFGSIGNQGSGQTIGIVDAFDDPNIEADLAVFSSEFGLPPCTTSNGCFKKVYAANKRPRTDGGWALEIALDVEWAHAIAPGANIVLVEAASNSIANLLQAVDTAVLNGASVVSMSWGGGEFSTERDYDSHFTHAGVTFTASSGDSGTGTEYPAASPFVIAVGGTTLSIDHSGNRLDETAWDGAGGGQSAYEVEPLYQANYQIPNNPGKRGIPDVAYNADPSTGFSVYDSMKYQGRSGWFQVGGTSAGSPQWAALFAVANSLRKGLGKPPLSTTNVFVYAVAPGNYNDITSGTNGSCGALCTASSGYDYVTGLGSPQAQSIISALVSQ